MHEYRFIIDLVRPFLGSEGSIAGDELDRLRSGISDVVTTELFCYGPFEHGNIYVTDFIEDVSVEFSSSSELAYTGVAWLFGGADKDHLVRPLQFTINGGKECEFHKFSFSLCIGSYDVREYMNGKREALAQIVTRGHLFFQNPLILVQFTFFEKWVEWLNLEIAGLKELGLSNPDISHEVITRICAGSLGDCYSTIEAKIPESIASHIRNSFENYVVGSEYLLSSELRSHLSRQQVDNFWNHLELLRDGLRKTVVDSEK